MKHQTPGSLKFKKLVRRLGVSAPLVAGTLEFLWISTQKNAPRGDIGRFTNEEIAIECGWDGDPDVLVDALTDGRWLDKHPEHRLVVHDWHEHAPQYVKAMVAKMGGFVTNCSGELQGGTVEGNCSKEQPDNVTKPNLTFIVDDGDDRIGLDESGTLWVPYRNVAKFAHAICVDLLGESNPRRSKRDHRLAIVCGVLRVSGRITAAPLQFAVESTKEARANNPFAYFRKVLASVLEANGVDLNRELQTTEIPESMLSIPPPSKLDATSKIGPVICDSS